MMFFFHFNLSTLAQITQIVIINDTPFEKKEKNRSKRKKHGTEFYLVDRGYSVKTNYTYSLCKNIHLHRNLPRKKFLCVISSFAAEVRCLSIISSYGFTSLILSLLLRLPPRLFHPSFQLLLPCPCFS